MEEDEENMSTTQNINNSISYSSDDSDAEILEEIEEDIEEEIPDPEMIEESNLMIQGISHTIDTQISPMIENFVDRLMPRLVSTEFLNSQPTNLGVTPPAVYTPLNRPNNLPLLLTQDLGNIFDNILSQMEEDTVRLVAENSFREAQSNILTKNDDILVITDKISYSDIQSQHIDQKKCQICLEEFDQSSQNLCITHCKHIFHTPCIEEWGKYNSVCPLCREDIPHDIRK